VPVFAAGAAEKHQHPRRQLRRSALDQGRDAIGGVLIGLSQYV
jgi:hypothetical protein